MAKAKKRIRAQIKETVKQTPKRKTETSKKLAYWAGTIATASAIASYTLSAFGMDPVSELTQAIFNGCIGYLITYAAKSLGEKISRNICHLDADGYPIEQSTDTPIDNEQEAKG